VHEKSLKDIHFKPEVTVKISLCQEFAEISVQDNGKGISEVEEKQLFSPFFTTKPTSKGTGLGLFMSQDIVKAHKGIISVDTKQDSLTAFVIKLPLATSPVNV
jgi:signal transduction histidine kinase